jgi:hypothetical protein
MPKTCVVCKKEESIMMVSVADESSGAFSSPVPVCEDCFHKLSKVRVVKIIESSNPAYLKDTVLSPHKTTVTSVAQTAASEKLYLTNILKLKTLFDVLLKICIGLTALGCVGMFLIPGTSPVAPFRVPVIAAGISGYLTNYVLVLVAEAAYDYLRRK